MLWDSVEGTCSAKGSTGRVGEIMVQEAFLEGGLVLSLEEWVAII